jgi:hypothetical protein
MAAMETESELKFLAVFPQWPKGVTGTGLGLEMRKRRTRNWGRKEIDLYKAGVRLIKMVANGKVSQ